MARRNAYGGDAMMDDAALLLNKQAAHCSGCGNVTKNTFLKDGRCPVCRDVATTAPVRPFFGSDVGVVCDVQKGPCACGAWH